MRTVNPLHANDKAEARSAFTLLELTLVLAVIVAISAVALPNIFDVLANRQLVRGADGVRVAMVQARIEAMRTGRTQMLRVHIGGDQFNVQAMTSLADVTEAADQMGRGTAVASGGVPMANMNTLGNQPAPPPLDTGDRKEDMLDPSMNDDRLPPGVQFSQVQVLATARTSTMAGNPLTAPTDGWSQPIYFYADGTTSNAVVTVMRENLGRVLVKIRGLTGETIVTEVMP